METRTLLVDSSNLFQRSLHGAKDVYTTFGHFGGVYQFLTTLRMLIKKHMINKVVLVWDGENGGIHRHLIDKEYKANRKHKEWYMKIQLTDAEIRRERDKERSVLKQKCRIKEYCENLFCRQIEVNDIEADDLIAAYCLKYNNKEEIFLYSNDRDFAQLLDLNITILFPNINQPVTKTNYIMHFNHHYKNALTMKIICGDDADNIAGIEGIGEKILLREFPDLSFKYVSVREICEKASIINEERLLTKKKPLKSLENLLNNVDRLKTNFLLTNLREPMLNEQAEEELIQLELPLDPTERSSKELYYMIIDDEFLKVYGSTFVQYVEPFYTVIMKEKESYSKFMKKSKKSL